MKLIINSFFLLFVSQFGFCRDKHKNPSDIFISLSVTVQNVTSNFFNGNSVFYDGSITAMASGGIAPYRYNISGAAYYQNNNGYFPMLWPGDYLVTVTDAMGQTATSMVTLGSNHPLPSLEFASIVKPSTCSSADGSLTLQASGGTPPYLYSIDGGVTFTPDNVFTGLYKGYYNDCLVKDAYGFLARVSTSPMLIFDIPELYFNCNCCPFYSNTGAPYTSTCLNTGVISVGVSPALGDNDTYTYSLDGINYFPADNPGGYSKEFDNLGPGIYHGYVKNSEGFISVSTAVIAKFCTVAVSYTTVIASCGQQDGSITIYPENGTPPYLYTMDGINYQAGNTFMGLGVGTYSISVKDATGTYNSIQATVYDRCPEVYVTATGETCAGNDGTITATATNGTAPYQYSIDGINFQNSNVFNGLATGNYTVTLRDALGFTSTATVFVPYICINVSAVAVNSTCANSNGSITASANNGTGPYTFSIDGINFQTANTFSGLAAGTYTVTGKDINGQTGTASVTINDIAGPQISATSSPAGCNNAAGTITVSALGGTAPFQYRLNAGSYQPTGVFTSLGPGNYTVSILDGNGCTSSQIVSVANNCPMPTATVTNETCSSHNGILMINITGGTAPYQYSVDSINFQTSDLFTGLSAGSYTITVKDALNTMNTTTATIQNICPTVTATVSNGYCGTANASIMATGANGTAPYQYSIDGINFQTASLFSNLVNGTYTITIKDVNGLTNTTTATVTNFPAPSLNVTSTPSNCLNNNGVISMVASGGSAPLQYSIDGTNFQAGSQFSNLSTGNYTAIVKDVNGCSASLPVTVILNNDLIVNAGGASDPTICEGDHINIPASSNGASFNWTPSTSLSNATTLNPAASPVTTTTYTLTATLGVCSQSDNVTVTVLPAPVANAGNDVTICYGQNVQLNGSGGVNYSWSPSTYLDNAHLQNPTVTHPVNTITYNLTVTGSNGCSSLNTTAVTVNVTAPALVFAGSDTSIVMGQPFQLFASDVNNSGFTQYSWSPAVGLDNSSVQNPVAVISQDMTYTVTAATAAGCEGTDAIRLKVYKGPEIYVPSAFTPNNDGKNDILRAVPVGIKQFNYFMIYNRWGQRVFYTKDPASGWDGKIQGVDQNSGVFTWIADGIDDKGNHIQRKGTVTLIR